MALVFEEEEEVNEPVTSESDATLFLDCSCSLLRLQVVCDSHEGVSRAKCQEQRLLLAFQNKHSFLNSHYPSGSDEVS